MNQNKAELWISTVLRAGVLFSGALFGMGLLFSFQLGNSPLGTLLNGERLSYSPPAFNSSFFTQPTPLFLINLGILVLVCLPITRVALTFLIFLFQKDFIFTLLSGAVLLVLIFGLTVQSL